MSQEPKEGEPRGKVHSDHIFQVPAKRVKNPAEIQKWLDSQAYQVSTVYFYNWFFVPRPEFWFHKYLQDYLGFIFSVGDAIKGLKIRDFSKQNLESVQGLVDLLKTLSDWIDEIPPLQQEQRFGNKAFRDWYTKLQKVSYHRHSTNEYDAVK